MNVLGMNLLWAAIQATLLCVATGAVYFAARRRQPGAGAIAAWSGLMLCGALTMALFSPWPSWSLRQSAAVLFARAADATSALQPGAETARNAHAGRLSADSAVDSRSRPEMESPATGGALVSLWRRVLADLSDDGARSQAPVSRWPGWIALGIVLSMIVGGAQLLTGWFGVRSCLRRSRSLADPALHEVMQGLQRGLGFDGRVALRESDDLTCAATVGGRAPVILLPPEWRSWSPQELRAVLAHELAHVAAGDARIWLVAQIGLLLHFYHPLVHWLAQRLRLEQELAADAVAVRLTGSSQAYLETLASLAVRHAARPAPWPLRAFLPAPGTLLRRIEMLRDLRQVPITSKRWMHGTTALVVALCAVLVAGVRPEQPASAEAEQMAVKKVRSRENLKSIALAFHNYADQNGHFPPAVLRGPDGKATYSWRVAILPLLGEQALYDQYDRNQPWDSEQNRNVLEKMPAVFRHPLDESESTNSGYFVFTGVNAATGEAEGAGVAMREFTDGTSNTLLAVEARQDIPWTKPEDLPYAQDQAPPKVGGWFEGGFQTALADGSVHFLDSQMSEQQLREVITRNGNEIVDLSMLAVRSAPAAATTGTPTPTPGTMTPKELTRLNLKKIALAFHLYHDVFLHFPPPVLYGPDGKTPYSWRVELLPVLKYYVDQEQPNPLNAAITREAYHKLIADCGYDVSQPWDSEANRKVLARIPDVYRSPLDDAGSTNASYFVLAGPGTAVGNTPGTGIAIPEIRDGLSNTLLLLEAKHDVPWTKPEDIPFAPGQGLTKTGQWEQNGFHVALADGSVKFITAPADPSALLVFITRDAADDDSTARTKLGLD